MGSNERVHLCYNFSGPIVAVDRSEYFRENILRNNILAFCKRCMIQRRECRYQRLGIKEGDCTQCSLNLRFLVYTPFPVQLVPTLIVFFGNPGGICSFIGTPNSFAHRRRSLLMNLSLSALGFSGASVGTSLPTYSSRQGA